MRYRITLTVEGEFPLAGLDVSAVAERLKGIGVAWWVAGAEVSVETAEVPVRPPLRVMRASAPPANIEMVRHGLQLPNSECHPNIDGGD